jgi:hypothetical protein
MLGARYSPSLCVCCYCTCTSLCHKLSISAPSYSQARLFGCVALMCSSFALHVSFYAWRPLPAVAVLCLIAHASHFAMAGEVSSFVYVSAAPQLYCSDAQKRRASASFYARRRYSLFLCVCNYCTCTSLFHKLSISAPSSIHQRVLSAVLL